MKFRQLAIISFLFSFCIASIGQGMTIHAGTSSMKTDYKTLTTEDSAHTGYHVGADGRLGDDGFYFMIGLQYHKLNFNGTPDFTFKVDDASFGVIKGKGGVAFRIFEINEKIVTRIRMMGAIDYLLKAPLVDTSDNPSNLDFNEAVAGLVGGLEVDVYFLTFNFEYQRGFFNSVKGIKGTNMNYLTTSIGINF